MAHAGRHDRNRLFYLPAIEVAAVISLIGGHPTGIGGAIDGLGVPLLEGLAAGIVGSATERRAN